MKYLLILFMLLCSPVFASEAQTVINNAVINGQFSQKTGYQVPLFNYPTVTTSYISIPVVSNNNQIANSLAFSVELWIKPSTSYGTSTTGSRIFSWGDIAWVYINSAQQIGVRLLDGTAKVTATNETVPYNNWTHIVITWISGSAPKIYFNSVEKTYAVTAAAASDFHEDILLIGNGKGTVYGDRPYGGWIRTVRLFRNVLLTQEQINTLYNSGVYVRAHTSVAGVSSEFLNGTGLTEIDTALYGSQTNGTLVNGVLWEMNSD